MPKTIQERFEAFDEANPDVMQGLVKLARQAKAKGHKQIGIEMLYCVLRWQRMMTTTDASSSWKLNNSYRSRFARKIMADNPDLRGFFETRLLTEAGPLRTPQEDS